MHNIIILVTKFRQHKMEERSIFFSGPNSQALALQQKLGGGRLSSVRLQYITPKDVSIPTFSKSKQSQLVHRPLLIEEALPPKKEADGSSFRTLDGFLLLEKSNMAFPDDSRQAVLSKMRLKKIVEEDLTFFTGLITLDVSENFLELAPFGVLPKLKQLNICCNNITNIPNLSGFDRLQTLDISYNRLSHASVQALENLPSLTELDLSGNNLRSLPVEMYRLFTVEKLMLENNKIAENEVFTILCSMPRLRELSLAYNFLSKISPECCSEGFFPLLEDLDLAFNYFGEEAGLLPLLDLPRLKRTILYGNPVLGPTGEDPLKIYIEDLVSVASSAREGSHMFPVEVVFLQLMETVYSFVLSENLYYLLYVHR
jgi:Leucine-rich repeat (LRR) protein